jgi:hypothetical protein
MPDKLIMFAIALCASLASGQTSTELNQDRTFRFTHTESTQQLQEIATLIRSIGDIRNLSIDDEQKAMTVHGTADEIALAGWLFNELDRPGNQQPPQGQSGTLVEFHVPGTGDNVVRVFYLPYAKTVQEFQEAATLVRNITNIRRLFTFNAPRAVTTRGTADQSRLAEWLFNELAKPADQDSAARQYRMPGGADDVIRVFHMPHTKTVQDFQEVATLIRSIADIRQLFTYNAPRAVALRGNSDQVSLAAWLANELDKPATNSSASAEYRMSDGPENVVRVFYLRQAATVQEFQQIAIFVRTRTSVRRAFTYNAPRALALRGTVTQLGQAAQLIAERSNPN